MDKSEGPASAPSAPAKFVNPVRARLAAGEAVLGCTITVASVELAAQVASMGFDFLWIEMEHSPITLETARHMVLATRGLQALPFIRVPVNELWTAKRVLDAGAIGVMFPFCHTPALAKQAAEACHYPPHGKRGAGGNGGAFRWPSPNYSDFIDEQVMVIVIIESLDGLANVEEIAATPGVDVIFIGTNDLSFAMGYRGSQEPADYQAALLKIRDAAHRHGKIVGRPVTSAADVKVWHQKGFQFFQLPSDLNFLRMGVESHLKQLGRYEGAVTGVY